jgi:hypothetical protein
VGQVAMLGGRWLLEPLALLMLAVAAVSGARLTAAFLKPLRRSARPGGAAVMDDVAQLLMAIATAGMLAPGMRTLPDTGWVAVFAVLTTWFAARSVRVRAARTAGAAVPGCAPHLAHCAAMLYMFLALPAAPGAAGAGPAGMTMAGMAGSAPLGQSALFHALAVLGALVVVGYCVRDVGQLSGRHYRVPGAVPVTGALLSKASRLASRAVMGLTMAVLLVIMT